MGQAQTKNKKKEKTRGVHKLESNEEYFVKNGGILLEKQISLSRSKDITRELKVLSEEEIKNATNNYDRKLISFITRDANIYRATLDERLVFIKAPLKLEQNNSELADLFLTEVSISMVMSHENSNKLYGCCLDTYVPIIVYHYAKCSPMHHYLHGYATFEKPIKWKASLKVATNVAYALSYMHNALSKPIVHRDVKSTSVLIDSSFHAILVNVARSVSITPGKKEQRWPVHGTPGYMDPEYVETQEVTDKCDVYSFGVLMLELLTLRDPAAMARCGKDLVVEFVSAMEINGIEALIDVRVLEDDHNIVEMQRFARLALKCVAKKGDDRPTMINVVEELWRIHDHDDNKCRTDA